MSHHCEQVLIIPYIIGPVWYSQMRCVPLSPESPHIIDALSIQRCQRQKEMAQDMQHAGL